MYTVHSFALALLPPPFRTLLARWVGSSRARGGARGHKESFRMGILDKFTSLFAPRKTKVRVICVGLDNSGKSTVINYLKPKKVRCCRAPAPAAPAVLTLPPLCRVSEQSTSTEVVPTVGFSVEEFAKGNLGFTVFDMSGQVLSARHTLTLALASTLTLSLAPTRTLSRGGTATCGSTTTRTAAASSSRSTRAIRSGCASREMSCSPCSTTQT